MPPARPATARASDAGRTVSVFVAEHTLAIELDGETRTIRRTTTLPVRILKAHHPHQPRPSTTSTELSASADQAKS